MRTRKTKFQKLTTITMIAGVVIFAGIVAWQLYGLISKDGRNKEVEAALKSRIDIVNKDLEKYNKENGKSFPKISYDVIDENPISINPGECLYKSQESKSKEFARKLFELTNIERKKAGVDELEWSDKLADAEKERTDDLAKTRNFWFHVTPNTGTTNAFLESKGILRKDSSTYSEPVYVSSFNSKKVFKYIPESNNFENLSIGDRTPESSVTAFVNEKAHRDEMLNKEWKYMGASFSDTDDCLQEGVEKRDGSYDGKYHIVLKKPEFKRYRNIIWGQLFL